MYNFLNRKISIGSTGAAVLALLTASAASAQTETKLSMSFTGNMKDAVAQINAQINARGDEKFQVASDILKRQVVFIKVKDMALTEITQRLANATGGHWNGKRLEKSKADIKNEQGAWYDWREKNIAESLRKSGADTGAVVYNMLSAIGAHDLARMPEGRSVFSPNPTSRQYELNKKAVELSGALKLPEGQINVVVINSPKSPKALGVSIQVVDPKTYRILPQEVPIAPVSISTVPQVPLEKPTFAQPALELPSGDPGTDFS